MKKWIIALCVVGAAFAVPTGWRAYKLSGEYARLSQAMEESKSLYIQLRGSDKPLPEAVTDQSGREYIILRLHMDHRRDKEIFAVTSKPVIQQDHVVIYHSGVSGVQTAEDLFSVFIEEIKSTP